jgi:hypothetical protein
MHAAPTLPDHSEAVVKPRHYTLETTMNAQTPTTTPPDATPNLGEIAFEAEQQAYRVHAILETLAEAAPDDNHWKLVIEGAAILLEPVCSQLSTLCWELHPGQKTHEPTEEVQP